MAAIDITLHCIHNDDAPFSVVVKSNDEQSTLYAKVCDHLGVKEGSIELVHNGEVIKCDETKIESTELTDGAEIMTTMSTAQKAKAKLHVMGIHTFGPKELCEAAAAGDCEKIKLLIDAGVDVNCTMPDS